MAALTASVTLGVQLSGRFEQAPAWVPIVLYSAAAVLAVATATVKGLLEKLQRRLRRVCGDLRWAVLRR
jgi:hypothetical protein